MTAIPMGVAPARDIPTDLRSGVVTVDLSALAVRAGMLLERALTLVVLGLMVVAGLVIAAVTVGVMTGSIS